MDFNFIQRKIDKDELLEIFNYLDDSFVPSLKTQVNLSEYSIKLSNKASFIFLNCGSKTIGLVAYYISMNKSFITSICIHKDYFGLGLGTKLFNHYLTEIIMMGVKNVELEVHMNNVNALRFYKRLGFNMKRIADNKFYCNKRIE